MGFLQRCCYSKRTLNWILFILIRCSHQYTVLTHCFHPKRKPTISLETDTAVMHYHSAIIMLLSIHLSIGAVLHCNFFSFFRLCNLVLLSLHCISFHCIIFVHVCCMMFNKVSVSVSIIRARVCVRGWQVVQQLCVCSLRKISSM